MAVHLSQGRMLPYVLTDSCFFLSLSLSTIITSSECLSGSIRSRIKLSGHLPPALKHEGERFGDHSENNRPSLLLCSSNTGAVYPGSCAQGPRGLTLCALRATVLLVRRGNARVNTWPQLCGAEPAQWPESTAPTGPIIAQWGGIPTDRKKRSRQKDWKNVRLKDRKTISEKSIIPL